MNECILAINKDFIFYWVDGIYMEGGIKSVAKSEEIFTNYGYNVKFKKIKQIYFHEKGFDCNDYGTHVRNFNYPYTTSKGEKMLNYMESLELKKLANDIINKDIDLTKNYE